MEHVSSTERIETVTRVVQNLLKLEVSPSPSQDLSILGLDSILSIQLILNLEQTFELTFEDEDFVFDNFSTIAKILNLLQERL